VIFVEQAGRVWEKNTVSGVKSACACGVGCDRTLELARRAQQLLFGASIVGQAMGL
jgi:hypothetical protein